MTLGGRHVISEGLRLCGARNVFDKLAPIAPQVAVEAVIAARSAGDRRRRTRRASTAGALELWQRFGALRAVANGHLIIVDADRINRHTPRLAEELAVLCARVDEVRRAGAVKSRS